MNVCMGCVLQTKITTTGFEIYIQEKKKEEKKRRKKEKGKRKKEKGKRKKEKGKKGKHSK